MKNINITTASWHEIEHKINIVSQFEDSLYETNIQKYTINFNALFVIFQSFPKDYPARKVETFKKMRRKTKTLELYLVLDYDKIMAGSDVENLEHIKEIFWKGCETFLKPMKGFDWNTFVKIAFPENQKLVA